jgi:hypothetical protein
VPGDDGVDGHQEVLREQLRVGELEREQPEAERRAGQQVRSGGLLDRQVGEDAHPHVDAPEEPGDDHRPPRAGQALRALGDRVLELLDQLVLERLVRPAQLLALLLEILPVGFHPCPLCALVDP